MGFIISFVFLMLLAFLAYGFATMLMLITIFIIEKVKGRELATSRRFMNWWVKPMEVIARSEKAKRG